MPVSQSAVWKIAGNRELFLDRPIVLGILNVTPDSFSDGGRFTSVDTALRHAEAMLREGADVIDVGGESTRPQGAAPVPPHEERLRIEPVVRAILERIPDAIVSVDTVKSDVAAAAIDAGAAIVNDVSGFRLDPRMATLVREERAGAVLMHSRGVVQDMATYAHARYESVVDEVLAELQQRVSFALESGIHPDSIVVDPGIGFAKQSAHSLAVLHGLDRIAALGYPMLVGASRKRFIGAITGVDSPVERIYGTVGAHVAALARGARLFRVHDVAAARQSLDVAWAILRPDAPG